MNGARPAGEMTARERCVKAEGEDKHAAVCVLLLPGAMWMNDAGTGEVAGAGAAEDRSLDEPGCVRNGSVLPRRGDWARKRT